MDQIIDVKNVSDDPYAEIPVLDLGPYLAGEQGSLEELGVKVRHIQETIGFWAVVNHGVSWQKLERTYEQLRRFFALTDEQKLKYRINELSIGYVPSKSTKFPCDSLSQHIPFKDTMVGFVSLDPSLH